MNMKSDRSKRVTVPLPQTINDLRSTANAHFAKGGGGRLKMYHKGEMLESQNQIRRVADDDVVIVRQETPDHGYPPPKTTNQSTFVEHPIEKKQASGPRIPQGSGMKSPAFQGRSSYTADYVEHAFESPQRKKPTAAWEPTGIPMTGRTAYAESYPWHETQRRPQTRPDEKKRDVDPTPFYGQSSYKMDYIQRKAERPTSAKHGKLRDASITPPSLPFNGTTTYSVDFKEPPLSRTERAHPSQWKNESGPPPPFKGMSEYTAEYLARELARAARVHLEPEDRRRSSEIQRDPRRSR